MSTLSIINLIIGTISTTITLSMLIIKPFRLWLLGIKKEKKREEEIRINQVEVDKCLLRDRILSVYYRHKRTKKLSICDYENLLYMYTQYKKLGGNSFVDKIWAEVEEWDVEH